jgi:hypothetical protein
MPRGMGARTGVIDSDVAPVACLISGTCWWAPTLYGVRSPITSLASRCALAVRPAPDVPEAATTTTSSGRAAPAARSGASASVTAAA